MEPCKCISKRCKLGVTSSNFKVLGRYQLEYLLFEMENLTPVLMV